MSKIKDALNALTDEELLELVFHAQCDLLDRIHCGEKFGDYSPSEIARYTTIAQRCEELLKQE